MAGKLKTEQEWVAYDKHRISQAVQEIGGSENLRFFFRSLLNAFGTASTPFTPDPVLTAKLCGRHEAGMDIIATMLEHQPTLYPQLLLEDANEQLDRQTPA